MPNEAQAAAILSQIEGKMEEYLALGENTPLSGNMSSMLSTVREALTDLRSSGVESSSEEKSEGEEASESGDSSPPDFRSATRAARNAMRNGTLRDDRGETKTPEDGEQSQDEDDEEPKKKRTKAF